MKFPVPADRVERVLAWIRGRWQPDPHGTGEAGDVYLVKSLYFDTPAFDVFHRRGSFGRAKFRVRRYGECPDLFLERKLKREGVVRKRRVAVDPREIERLLVEANGAVWEGAWFHHRLALRGLRPVVMMNYRRVARWGEVPEGRVRVTLDRELRAVVAGGIQVPEVIQGADLLGGGAVLEIKFPTSLPAEVRVFLEETGLSANGFSKYRLGVKSCGLLPAEDVVGGGEGI